MNKVETIVEVRHNPAESRFEATVEGRLCTLNYHLAGDVMRIHHTGVPAALEGRGIASRIVHAALAYAQANGLKVEPWCSFVRAYIRRHPDTQSLLATPLPNRR